MSEESTIDPEQSTTISNDDPQPVTVVEAPTITPESQPVIMTELSTPTPQPNPQPPLRPPPSQSFQPPVSFMEAYDCAKLNNSWHKVSTALTAHPDWLTRIPTGRRWTILHQIVFSGDISHLNEVLGIQLNNPDFHFLCKTLDEKTVRDVAIERQHVHPQILRRIERIVATDQLLNNARDRKWGLVKQSITTQPDIVNEKPPYRPLYLAHYLASMGELDMFKELSKICHFQLNLLADNKSISQTARDNDHAEFAEYIDSLIAASSQTNGNGSDSDSSDDDNLDSHSTGHAHYSPGFYEDPGMSFIPANFDVTSLFTTTASTSSHHHNHTPSFLYASNPMSFHVLASPSSMEDHTVYEEHPVASDPQQQQHQASAQAKPTEPAISEADQAAYENTVTGNIKHLSEENLLNSITCCITKTILRDPVVAADGFTYEREAIENWLKHSTRSPMTNQELENCELKPNHAIKSILQLLQQNKSPSASSNTNKEDSDSAK